MSYWVYHGALAAPLEDYLASFCTVVVCFKDTLCDSNVSSLLGIFSKFYLVQTFWIIKSFTLTHHMLQCINKKCMLHRKPINSTRVIIEFNKKRNVKGAAQTILTRSSTLKLYLSFQFLLSV